MKNNQLKIKCKKKYVLIIVLITIIIYFISCPPIAYNKKKSSLHPKIHREQYYTKLPSNNSYLLYKIKYQRYVPLVEKAIPFVNGNLSFFNYSSYYFPRNIIIHHRKEINGSNVKVAIIDTGINITPWFNDTKFGYLGRVYYNSTSKKCSEDNKYYDYNGHGTHVAGILHAFAPGSILNIIKASKEGTFSIDDLICAIKKAIELNSTIISMSLGGFAYFTDCDPTADPLCNFILNISKSHPSILFSIAAGNEGELKNHYQNFKNKSVKLYIKDYGNRYLSLIIRWYNTSKNIKNIEIINKSNNLLLCDISFNGTYYIGKYYPKCDFNFTPYCTKQQCLLDIFLSCPFSNEYVLYINTSGFEYDVYLHNTSLYDYNIFLYPNNNSRSINTPGINPNVFTVGSICSYDYSEGEGTCIQGAISSFSSRGDVRINESYSILKPEILMPGQEIKSASAKPEVVEEILSGTSMATPAFSGVLALIKQILPSITYKELKANLSSITDENSYQLSNSKVYEKGHGLINITKVINSLPIMIGTNNTSLILKNYVNETWLLYNISFKGIFRAKINNKKYYPNKNYTINISLNLTHITHANNYSIPIEIRGEFLNSPYKNNIFIIATSNISITNYSYSWINNSYINISFYINNNGLNALECTFKLNNKTIKKDILHNLPTIVWINKTKIVSENNTLLISCPNNIGLNKYSFPLFGKYNISINYSNILSNLTINITWNKIFFKNNFSSYYINISGKEYYIKNNINSTLTVDPSNVISNTTHIFINITMELDDKINISLASFSFKLNNPLNLSIIENNTFNKSYLGSNSSLKIHYELNESIQNNASLIISLGNHTFNLNITPIISKNNYSLPLIGKLFNKEDTLKSALHIYIKRKNIFLKILSKNYIVDTKKPLIKLNYSYNFYKIMIPLHIKENNFYLGKIIINNLSKTFTSNNTIIEFNSCKNTTAKLLLWDKANNTVTHIIHISCLNISNSPLKTYIDGIYTNTTKFPINISYIDIKESKKEYSNKIIKEKNESIFLYPIKNTAGLIKIKFNIPKGYRLKEVIKYSNNTLSNITSYTIIKEGKVYAYLNITKDPIISAIFYTFINKQHPNQISIYKYKNSEENTNNLFITNNKANNTKIITLIINNKSEIISLKKEKLLNRNIILNNTSFSLYINIYPNVSKGKVTINSNQKTININVYNSAAIITNLTFSKNYYGICKLPNITTICKNNTKITRNLRIILKPLKKQIKEIKITKNKTLYNKIQNNQFKIKKGKEKSKKYIALSLIITGFLTSLLCILYLIK